MNGFGQGCRDVSWAATYLSERPRLWLYVLAPAVVAAVILGLSVWFVYGLVTGWTGAIVGALPSWLSFLGTIFSIVVFFILIGVGYFGFLATAAVCTAPFCELLSEAVETDLGGREPPPFSFPRLLRDLGVGLGHGLRRVLAYAGTMLALLIAAAIVPVVGGIVYAVGGAWVSVRFAAYDALDAIWARRDMSYAEKMTALQTHRDRAYGIGAMTALLMAVPLVNLVALPLAAVAATRLVLDNEPRPAPSTAGHLKSS